MKRFVFTAGLVAALVMPAFAAEDDDPPLKYKDRGEARDAYREGYERGYDRGYQRGLREGERRAETPVPAPPKAAPTGPIRITGAFYGTSSRTCNATRWVARRADGKRAFSVKVSNEICGDPAHGDRKSLEVSYQCGGMSKTASAREHQTLFLSCN
ncbi:MAG TPA: hypothetical protein VEC19_18155 [Usitatibacter sp.]|nr:hypothetical protein [Usitatibacter sp.]